MQINIEEYEFYVRPGSTDMRKRATALSRIVQDPLLLVPWKEEAHPGHPAAGYLRRCPEEFWDSPVNRLASVIDELFHAVPYVREERLEREERERRYREEEERRARRQELIRNEKRKVYELTENTNNYVLACNIRAYAAAVESKPDLSEEEKEWVLWAREKADWIDPMIKKEDAILGKYSKSVLDKESYY